MKKYQVNTQVKLVNSVMRSLLRFGIGPAHTYLLTVAGRKTGKSYSTPVTVVEDAARRWLVAPYGEVGWVQNARTAGEVILTRRGRRERVSIFSVGPEESAPVLKKYVALEPITRPYFQARADSPLEAFQAEATRHPVFRITNSRSC
jgi:deazaflavin-dependent oxidoreductase (nitroreductase family)